MTASQRIVGDERFSAVEKTDRVCEGKGTVSILFLYIPFSK